MTATNLEGWRLNLHMDPHILFAVKSSWTLSDESTNYWSSGCHLWLDRAELREERRMPSLPARNQKPTVLSRPWMHMVSLRFNLGIQNCDLKYRYCKIYFMLLELHKPWMKTSQNALSIYCSLLYYHHHSNYRFQLMISATRSSWCPHKPQQVKTCLYFLSAERHESQALERAWCNTTSTDNA